MSLNKKLIRNIIIAIVVLAALGAAYYFAVKWQPKTEENKNSSLTESISLFSADADSVNKIVYKSGDESFSIVKSGSKDSEKWEIPEKPNISFSQSKLKNASYDLTSVSASKKIENNSGNLSDFGLENAQAEVTVFTNDGETTFILGDKLVVDSSYYFMKKGDSLVYTVSEYVAKMMLKKPNDFRETNLATISTENITELSINHGGKPFMAFKKSEKESEHTLQMASMVMTYPYEENLRSEQFSELLSAFTGVEVLSFVSDNIADAAKYGIDKGFSVVIKENDKEHKISFGNTAEDGNVYATYNDCGFIFTMLPDMQNAFKDIKPFDLVEKFAHIYTIDNVSDIDIKSGKGQHTLSISRTGSGDDEKCTYKVDGKDAEEDAFKGMYQIIIGLMITDNDVDNSKVGKEIMDITFNMTDKKKYTAKYYEYDERSVMVKRPDGKQYLMLKKYVDSMQNSLEEFVKRPTKKPETNY